MFREVIPRVDPRLVLDQGDVHYVTEPYAGVEYGLRLGSSGARWHWLRLRAWGSEPIPPFRTARTLAGAR